MELPTWPRGPVESWSCSYDWIVVGCGIDVTDWRQRFVQNVVHYNLILDVEGRRDVTSGRRVVDVHEEVSFGLRGR